LKLRLLWLKLLSVFELNVEFESSASPLITSLVEREVIIEIMIDPNEEVDLGSDDPRSDFNSVRSVIRSNLYSGY